MGKKLEAKNWDSITNVCRIPPKVSTRTYYTRSDASGFLKQPKVVTSLAVILLTIVAWSPWITSEYAQTVVVDSLGGPDASFYYLGENVTIKDIPIYTTKVPFAILVYFPGEAMYIVPFWGGVLISPSLGLGTYGD